MISIDHMTSWLAQQEDQQPRAPQQRHRPTPAPMPAKTAAEVLQNLAESMDRADVITALYAAIKALGSKPLVRANAAATTSAPSGLGNARKPWTSEEDARLNDAIEAGKSIEEVAREHGRSELAIRSRLLKLGTWEA